MACSCPAAAFVWFLLRSAFAVRVALYPRTGSFFLTGRLVWVTDLSYKVLPIVFLTRTATLWFAIAHREFGPAYCGSFC